MIAVMIAGATSMLLSLGGSRFLIAMFRNSSSTRGSSARRVKGSPGFCWLSRS